MIRGSFQRRLCADLHFFGKASDSGFVRRRHSLSMVTLRSIACDSVLLAAWQGPSPRIRST